jgi:flagellar basal-body rod protein FlgB
MDKLDAEFAFGRQSLDVRAYRQTLLSSNIANADTPGYKARDVDFASALSTALRQGGATGQAGTAAGNASPLAMTQPAGVASGMSMATTQSGHMAGTAKLVATGGPADSYGQLAYRVPIQPALDGNTVDLDSERIWRTRTAPRVRTASHTRPSRSCLR